MKACLQRRQPRLPQRYDATLRRSRRQGSVAAHARLVQQIPARRAEADVNALAAVCRRSGIGGDRYRCVIAAGANVPTAPTTRLLPVLVAAPATENAAVLLKRLVFVMLRLVPPVVEIPVAELVISEPSMLRIPVPVAFAPKARAWREELLRVMAPPLPALTPPSLLETPVPVKPELLT